MMRFLISTGVAVLALAVLSTSTLRAAEPTWTILIYGHGDHNLSPSLVVDFLEMQRSAPTDTFRVVVQTDYQASEPATYEAGLPRRFGPGVTRWLVTPSGGSRVASQVLERLPELDSDRQRNLAAFLQWGLARFPADRVGVVLWDHGASWAGYGSDEQNGTVKRPKLMGLNEILRGLQTGLAGRKVDFLAFDACLMGNQEVIGQLRGLADIFIANAEIDYGPGWDYEAALGWLRQNPAAAMADFARVEAESYRKHHAGDIEDRYFQAHFAYDYSLAETQFLPAAKRFAALLRRNFTERVARARRDAPTYYAMGFEPGEVGRGDSAYVDLPALADRLAKDPRSGSSLRRAARGVSAGAAAMRLAAVRGTQKRGAGGVNVYLPFDQPSAKTRRRFSQLLVDDELGWSRVIRAAVVAKRGSGVPVLAPPSGPVEAAAGSVVPLAFTVTAGRPYAVTGLICTGETVLGEAGRVVVDGRPGTFRVQWDAKVPEIAQDGRRVLLPAFGQRETPISVADVEFRESEDDDDPTPGTLVLEEKNGRLRVIAATAAPPGVASRGVEPPAGTLVTPLFARLGEDVVKTPGAESFIVPPGGIEALDVRFAPLAKGTYTLRIGAENAFGLQAQSVAMSVVLR